MVHKKSEYTLQYHLLSNDIRKQIWQDNVKFREFRRSTNQADHYWAYQLTDEHCDCETIDEDVGGSLPPHKLKHKVLLAKYGDQKPERVCSADGPRPLRPPDGSKCPEVQQQSLSKATETDQPSAREMSVQTPDWGTKEKRKSDDPSYKLQNMMQNLSVLPPDGDAKSKKSEEHHQRSKSPLTERPLSVAETSRYRSTSALDHKGDGRNVCKTTTNRYLDESTRQLSPFQFSSLSKTSRKSYFDERKSPFVSFGWNETHTDVGEKKTYNVSAPRREVHPHALNAMKHRKADIEKYLAHECERLRHIQTPGCTTNLSGIWMSEYQDKYNHGIHKPLYTERIPRPCSAPILKKPVCWRYS